MAPAAEALNTKIHRNQNAEILYMKRVIFFCLWMNQNTMRWKSFKQMRSSALLTEPNRHKVIFHTSKSLFNLMFGVGIHFLWRIMYFTFNLLMCIQIKRSLTFSILLKTARATHTHTYAFQKPHSIQIIFFRLHYAEYHSMQQTDYL